MGRKGKSKGGGGGNTNPPKAEEPKLEVEEVKATPVVEVKPVPVVEIPVVIAPTKVDEKVIEKPVEVNELPTIELSNSQKKKNKKNSNKAEEPIVSEAVVETKKVETVAAPVAVAEKVEDEPAGESNSETLKKKRKRNKNKKTNSVVIDEDAPEKEESPKVETPKASSIEPENASDTATMKKRKRNKNKNKNKSGSEEPAVVEEVIEEPVVQKIQEKVEARVEALPAPVEVKKIDAPRPEPRTKGKQKPNSIPDELKIKQEREQQEARVNLKNEIERREKLMEKIDAVLDNRKSDAKLAKDQQTLLGNMSKELSKVKIPEMPDFLDTEPDVLFNKIEQVLGVTKLEIKNVQNQQAFVGRLEHELAKVKQTKDKYLRGDTASTSNEPEAPVKLPDHIEKLKQELMEIKKDAPKRPKEELIREIESRDLLMLEINKVLDTTKTEIQKVQKQQKIIANLETELYKIKDKEIDDSIKYVADHMDDEAPPEQRAASGTSNLLDALMANVAKLKEAQALKKQKSEEDKPKSGDKAPKEKKSADTKQKAEAKPAEIIAVVESPKEEQKQTASKPESPKADPKKSPKDQKSKQKPVVAPTVEAVKPVEVIQPVEIAKPVEVVKEAPKPAVQEAPKAVVQEAPKPIVQEAPKAEVKKEQPKKEEAKIELKKEQPKQEQPKIQEKVAEILKQEEKPVETPKLPENKNHEKQKNGSPKNAQKNKNNNNKKESPAPIKKIETPELVPVIVPAAIEAWGCKLSMAEMLKNAPLSSETPIVEIPAKLEVVEEIKIQTVAPKPIEIPKPVEIPKKIEEIIPIVKEEASKVVDDMVIVDKADVEAAQAAEQSETNESLGNSKNAEGSGFVSAVSKDDVKSLKNDENATKSKSPMKNLPNARSAQANKSPASKSPVNKTTPAPAATAAVPKAKPAPKVNETKKSSPKPAPAKTVAPAAPTQAKPSTAPQPSVDVAKPAPVPAQSTPVVSEKPAAKPVDALKNGAKPVTVKPASKSPSSPKKPDLPPKPDHLKNGKPNTPPSPPIKPGNECPLVKSKSPSPTKSSPVAVTKPVVPPTQTHTPITAKPKPIVPPRPATVRNNITQPNPQKASPNKPNKAPAKSQGTKMTSTSTFDFRYQLPLVENKSDVLCAAFRKNMDNNSLEPNPLSKNIPPSSTNTHMKAILTKDNIKIILTQSTPEENVSNNFLSKVISQRKTDEPINVKPDKYSTRIPIDLTKPFKLCNHDEDDDDDDNKEFKSSPRQVFMATICQVCKVNLSRYLTCHGCQMVSYCKEEHLKIDYINHRSLCRAMQLIAKKRGGHIYNLVRNLNSNEYRSLRVHTINLCEQYLNRQLLSFEREILMYPRLCHDVSCQEWNVKELNDCNGCHQVSYCTLHPLTNTAHDLHCTSFALYQKIILRQKSYGRIEVAMPHRVLKEEPELTNDVDLTLKLLYKNVTAFRDDCVYAALLSIATAPLTAFYAFQQTGVTFGERMVIHLVGAELQFEGDTLDKWEAFFLHLAPNVSDLQIAFIGPELNAENLPIQVISRTRMCRTCRQLCRGVRFDFHCKKFYHDYCTSTSFVKPDLICFFNAGLNKKTGFKGFDTWPKTIQSAFDTEVPVLVTSYTEHEIPLDLERINNQIGKDSIQVLHPPSKNPFSSSRPERNFTSDDVTPLIFKNNYFFVARKHQKMN